ncbi:hypothetical protein TL16_g06831 [Triparma laevis f. inornata]|uniref:Uncharacterized protein n=1 Tax=Triparma laevis f. inornata TaxID=1714386 RepID=A0A9W7AS58_9STRA|nr:hypothetical protein TL16_g06831 [Triparma laevis f. inornata]
MSSPPSSPPTILLLGPTSTGKSSLTPFLPSHTLINLDSMQLYSNLPISTASCVGEMYGIRDFITDDLLSDTPTPNLISEPNLPLSFFNYTVKNYLNDIQPYLSSPDALNIFIGGTMYYALTLIQHLDNSRIPSSEATAQDIEWFNSLDDPYKTLIALEPGTGIHPNNIRKIRDRLLNLRNSKSTVSSEALNYEAKNKRVIVLYVDYENDVVLKERIISRIIKMVEKGLKNEIDTFWSLYKLKCETEEVPNVGLFQAIGFKEFLPYLKGECGFEDCLEVLENATWGYVKGQRKFFRNKIVGDCECWGIEMGGVEMDDVGKFVESLISNSPLQIPGITKLEKNKNESGHDKIVRECERCKVTLYGGIEWEVHLKSKLHKVRGSKKFKEKEANKLEFMNRNLEKTGITTSPTTPTPPPPHPPTQKLKNSANKNKYTINADSTYTTSLLSFGKPVSISIRQTSNEDTWPGGALWDPGVVVSKLFGDKKLTPIPQTKLRSLNVLELGAGCGMTGIVLGVLGARWVCCSDMIEVCEGVTKVNVELNKGAYTPKGGISRVNAMPGNWGEDYLNHFDSIFARMECDTKSKKLDCIIAVDIAYQRPGMPPHFEWFIESIRYIYEFKCDVVLQGGRKKKGKNKVDEKMELPIFVYGHRRRMGSSEDLLKGIYEWFEDVREPIPADEIDGRMFKREEKHGIMVHVLRWKGKTTKDE